jgi:hypothetical protein
MSDGLNDTLDNSIPREEWGSGYKAAQPVQSAETPREPYVGREFVKQPDLSAVIERIVAATVTVAYLKRDGLAWEVRLGDMSVYHFNVQCNAEVFAENIRKRLRSALQEFEKEMRG